MDTGEEKPTILIVEDDQIISRIVEMKLMESGYAVFPVVISGEEAIQSAVNDLPGIILMDITLQGRIDGIEASRVIDALFKIPTVFITSHDGDQTVARIMTTSAATFLKKPFKLTDLLTNLEIITRNARHLLKSLGIDRGEYEDLAALLNSEGTGSLIIRPNGLILYANSQVTDLFGVETTDVILTPLSRYLALTDSSGQHGPGYLAAERFLGEPLVKEAVLNEGRGTVPLFSWKLHDPDEETVGEMVLFPLPGQS